jgi:hypothetical protein
MPNEKRSPGSLRPRPFRALMDRLRRLLRRRPDPEPEDPYAYRTAPLRRPPHGRSGAAVAELDQE